jgi:hypothetical protein
MHLAFSFFPIQLSSSRFSPPRRLRPHGAPEKPWLSTALASSLYPFMATDCDDRCTLIVLGYQISSCWFKRWHFGKYSCTVTRRQVHSVTRLIGHIAPSHRSICHFPSNQHVFTYSSAYPIVPPDSLEKACSRELFPWLVRVPISGVALLSVLYKRPINLYCCLAR